MYVVQYQNTHTLSTPNIKNFDEIKVYFMFIPSISFQEATVVLTSMITTYEYDSPLYLIMTS